MDTLATSPLDNIQSFSIVIRNPLGMHARPSSQIATTASRYNAKIHVECSGKKVNAKSIMGLLALAAPTGSTLTFVVTGEDALQALDALRTIADNFLTTEQAV